MNVIETIVEKAKAAKKTVVLPEVLLDGERTIKAVRAIKDRGIATPIITGNRDAIAKKCKEAGVSLDDIQSFDADTDPNMEDFAKTYQLDNAKKGVTFDFY